jgi:hypothetical protein
MGGEPAKLKYTLRVLFILPQALQKADNNGIAFGDPRGENLQSLNIPFGSYLFYLRPFRKQTIMGLPSAIPGGRTCKA